MERHQEQVSVDTIPCAEVITQGEPAGRGVLQVRRVIVIKDGEFVQAAASEPAQQAAAC